MGASRVAPSSGSRLAGIEGLRALAASSIVVFHCWLVASPSGAVRLGVMSRFVFPNLPVGVTLFFALSGFLLYRPFAGALMRAQDGPRLRAYLRNRALRILPAYWVILLASACLLQSVFVRETAYDLGTGSLVDRPVTLIATGLFVQNYHPSTFF